MRFIHFLKGKDFKHHEQIGDNCFAANDWGKARLEYETALSKISKSNLPAAEKADIIRRLELKVRDSEEALARDHFQSAEEMMAAGYYDDALDYLELAQTLSHDNELADTVKVRLEEAERHLFKKKRVPPPDTDKQESSAAVPDESDNTDDYFTALCNTLPDDVREVYLSYGLEFKKGYTALNQGDFKTAAGALQKAMEENPDPSSFIGLELATAYLNLEQREEARELLEAFLSHHPEVLPAYQLLCEIFWEKGDFKAADDLLANLPEELKQSLGWYLMRGETLLRSGKTDQADAFYVDFLDTHGWNEQIARALAHVREAAGEFEKARDLYGEIMGQCQSCGSRTDPYIKRKFADLSLLTGQSANKVLELYFSLVREDPANSADYYRKISAIYEQIGNKTEARRYHFIADEFDPPE
jgi:tetratricopeptide (TPR) repeat protein